jgi:hypothetical protein
MSLRLAYDGRFAAHTPDQAVRLVFVSRFIGRAKQVPSGRLGETLTRAGVGYRPSSDISHCGPAGIRSARLRRPRHFRACERPVCRLNR